jgi:hypothetical protein
MTRRPRIHGTTAHRALFLLPEIRDDDSPERKNALAVRNACATEGRCPCCRAVGEVTADAEFAGEWHLTFRHEDGCVVLADGDAA